MRETGRTSRFAEKAALVAWTLALGLGSPNAWAARDRTPPTTPTNLRVTSTTSYSVSLAWNPSTDNSGQFSYVICCAYSSSATVGQQATTFTFTGALEAGRSFSLRIYARDAAGNTSNGSNVVTFRLPADTRPPTRPVVSLTGVGPNFVSLAWSSMEDGPHVWYTVFKDGTPVLNGTSSTSGIIPLLQPATAYTFTVRARDFGMNTSPLSDPLPAVTAASNPDDVTPPTTPANFRESSWGCETELNWDESTDDLDPPLSLEYQIYVNDVYDHSLTLRRTRTIVYGTLDGPNAFSVVAVDSAGNRSAPATVTAILDCVP